MSDYFSVSSFAVEIESITEACFAECSKLAVEMEVKEYREGGQNSFLHQLPGPVKHQPIVLKRGITQSAGLWQGWFKKISTGDSRNCRRSLSIVLYDITGREAKRWNVFDAFPIRWEGTDFNIDGNTHAIETLELAHNGFEEVK
ncbi:MAG: phage tail protein [Desulfamplus sp.]